MSLECFLNERSFSPEAQNTHTARQRMVALVQAMISAKTATRNQLPLRVPPEFFSLTLSHGYTLPQWLNDPAADRDTRLYFKSLVTKSPLLNSQSDRDQALRCEALWRSVPAQGMLAAFLTDGIVVSIGSDRQWDCAWLGLEIREMDESANVTCAAEQIRHFSTTEHVKEHTSWLQDRSAVPLMEPGDLWMERSAMFPALDFCDRVEDQLRSFPWGSPQRNQIIIRLEQLNSWWGSCRNQRLSGPRCREIAPCKLTPESEATLKRYAEAHTFRCPDGQNRLFSWHVRFTPGAGRIYFFWPDLSEKITVGHVGQHLPTIARPT